MISWTVHRCSSRLRTARCTEKCEQLHCRGEAATILSCYNSRLFSRTEWNQRVLISRQTCQSIVIAQSQELAVDDATHIEERDQLDFDCLDFFGLGNFGDFHWLFWRFVSGLTPRSKSCLLWRCAVISWHICLCCFLWSSFINLGTYLVQTFWMPKSSVIIF